MITSASNPQMRSVRDLLNKSKERHKQKLFVAEGLRMVIETPPQLIEQLYISESFYRKPPALKGFSLDKATVVDDQVFKRIADTQSPQGIMAVVRCPHSDIISILGQRNALLLFLENIQDPGNLGTMMRTAEGAGVTGIVISSGSVDIFNPKVVRATMGSLYRMPFVYVDDICKTMIDARKRGIHVHAAHLEGSICYDRINYRGSTAFLIGNEGNGLSKEAVAAATDCINIPMAGKLESLNAATAAAVLMYEANRQRRHIPKTGGQ